MSVAVLKNRMLDVSKKQFSEKAYGSDGFIEFLQTHFPTVIRLDHSRTPPQAIYLQADQTPPVAAPKGKWARIRPDLWQAVMDVRSGLAYLWDAKEGKARLAREGESTDLQLPTLTAEEFYKWRATFAFQLQPDSPHSEMVRRWVEKRLPTALLPAPLQGEWNRTLKDNIEKRLRDWFLKVGQDAPSDLIVEPPAPSPPVQVPDAVEELREVVSQCVSVMTAEELSDLRLSPALFLRARTKAGKAH
jgi:hypothetical protein